MKRESKQQGERESRDALGRVSLGPADSRRGYGEQGGVPGAYLRSSAPPTAGT